MLDEAVDFFQRFIQAEYEMATAAYGERDPLVYAQKYKEFERFLEGVKTLDSRGRDLDGFTIELMAEEGEDWFEMGKEVLGQLRPRTLFQVKHYLHPEWEDLFRGYLSHPRAALVDSYGFNFYAARVEDELRIIAIYSICDECNVTGRIRGSPCRECGATGWSFLEGRHLDAPGKLVGVRKLRPPTAPEQLAEYEAE